MSNEKKQNVWEEMRIACKNLITKSENLKEAAANLRIATEKQRETTAKLNQLNEVLVKLNESLKSKHTPNSPQEIKVSKNLN